MISTPEFGCELFVAQRHHATKPERDNRKLFTAIHSADALAQFQHRTPARLAGFR